MHARAAYGITDLLNVWLQLCTGRWGHVHCWGAPRAEVWGGARRGHMVAGGARDACARPSLAQFFRLTGLFLCE